MEEVRAVKRNICICRLEQMATNYERNSSTTPPVLGQFLLASFREMYVVVLRSAETLPLFGQALVLIMNAFAFV